MTIKINFDKMESPSGWTRFSPKKFKDKLHYTFRGSVREEERNRKYIILVSFEEDYNKGVVIGDIRSTDYTQTLTLLDNNEVVYENPHVIPKEVKSVIDDIIKTNREV